MKSNIFERITNQIIAAIEDGAPDFTMPWHQTGKALDCPTNAITGRAYRGLNVVTLWMDGHASGFQTGQWATYRQWNEHGAQVRKGERGTPIFFWQQRGHNDPEQDNGEDRRRGGFIAKGFTVFNADQVDGFVPIFQPEIAEDARDARAETFIRQVGATIRHGGDQAYYAPGSDTVQSSCCTGMVKAFAYITRSSSAAHSRGRAAAMPASG